MLIDIIAWWVCWWFRRLHLVVWNIVLEHGCLFWMFLLVCSVGTIVIFVLFSFIVAILKHTVVHVLDIVATIWTYFLIYFVVPHWFGSSKLLIQFWKCHWMTGYILFWMERKKFALSIVHICIMLSHRLFSDFLHFMINFKDTAFLTFEFEILEWESSFHCHE